MLEIKKNGNKLIWETAKDVGFNTQVTVHDGCVALVRRDGTVVDVVMPGSQVVKSGKKAGFFRKATDDGVWDVFGVDTSSAIAVPWGVGEIRYIEPARGDNARGELAANGTLTLKIMNGESFFKAMQTEGADITAVYVVNMLKQEVRAAVRTAFDDALNKGGGLDALRKSGIKLEAAVVKALRGKMFEKYGLSVTDVSVTVNSDGFEELDKAERERMLSEATAAKAKNDAEGLKAFGEALGALNAGAKAGEKKEEEKDKDASIIIKFKKGE